MFGQAQSHRAVFTYAAFGGPRPAAITWATLVGFVRGDVARVVVVGANGSRHPRPLGRNRGYSFSTTDPSSQPTLVIAYDDGGREIGRERIKLEAFTS
jgi:hypothetical protein